MEKACLILEIKKDKLEEYINLHKNAEKKLLKALNDSGFIDELIFIFKNYSIIYMEAEDINKAFTNYGKTETAFNWTKKIEPLLDKGVNFTKSGKVLGIEKVFDLKEQLKSINS